MNALPSLTNDVNVRAIGAGTLSACFIILALMGFYHVLLISIFPLFYMGLRDRIKPAVIATLISFILVAVTTTLSLGLYLAIFIFVPTLYLSYRATIAFDQSNNPHQNNYSNERLVLETLMICLSIMAINFIYMSTQFDVSTLEKLINQFKTDTNMKMFSHGLTTDYIMQCLRFAPGCLGLIFYIIFSVSGITAQQLLIKQNKNLRFSHNEKQFCLPMWPWLVLGVEGILAVIFDGTIIGDFALNVVLVLFGAFMIQGMSVFHAFSIRSDYKKIITIGFYFILCILPGLLSIVIIIGIFEPWIQWRQKFK